MKKLLLAALLLVSLGSSAQQLAMSPVAPAIDNDTIQNGHIDTSYVWVKNADANAFTGSIDLYSAVRDSLNPVALDSSVVIYSSPTLTLAAGDSVMLPMIIQYTVYPQIYRYGIDVIVVWPVSAGVITTSDSLQYRVFIERPNGVPELDLHQVMRLYPNPAGEQIFLDGNGFAEIREATIYDMSGRAVLSRKNETCIDIRELAPGMYSIDVILTGQKHYRFKFLRQ